MSNYSFIIDRPWDSSNNCTDTSIITISTDEFLDIVQDQATITMVPAAIYLLIVGITSIIGNSLVLYIYCLKFALNATKYLLMMLAGLDLLTAVIIIPIEMFLIFQNWTLHNVFLCKMKFYATLFMVLTCAMILLAVAVTNYRKVCCPFNWQITTRDAKKINLFTYFCGLIFSIPFAFVYGRTSKPTKECYKIYGYECYIDDSYKGTIWPTITSGIFVLFYIGCVTPLVCLYLRIGNTALKHRKMFGNDGNLSKYETCSTITSVRTSHFPEYLKDCSGEESEPQAPVPMQTSTLKMCGCTEQYSPNSKTLARISPDRMCLSNEEKLDPPGIRESTSAEFPHNSEDNINNESTIRAQNYKSGTDVDVKQFPGARDKVLEADVKYINAVSTFSENAPSLNYCPRIHSFGDGMSSRRSRNRTIIILILISFVYAASYFIHLLLKLYKDSYPKNYMNMSTAEMVLFNILYRSYYVNTATNPIIYNFFDIRFRRECKKCLRCIVG